MVESFDAAPGGVLIAQLAGDAFTIVSADTAMREVQEAVKTYAPKDGRSVVDRFLAQRRATWGEAEDDG